jgi:hypothetical protein
MTIKTEKYHDPLIDEVRQRRAELYAALGSDLRKLVQAIQELQRRHPDKVRKPIRRVHRPV